MDDVFCCKIRWVGVDYMSKKRVSGKFSRKLWVGETIE